MDHHMRAAFELEARMVVYRMDVLINTTTDLLLVFAAQNFIFYLAYVTIFLGF